MKLNDNWWTSPTSAENGRLIMVTGRDDMERAIASGRYDSRVDITWKYTALADGMPCDADAELMQQATDAMAATFAQGDAAILTGIYTGDGERNWVVYTRNLRVFSNLLNKALADLPTLPLLIEAEADPDWLEYKEMRDISYINPKGE